MEKELRFTRDGVQYVMTPANAMASWSALKRAAALFKGVDINEVKDTAGKDAKTSVAIGTLLSNLGEPSVAEIEALVYASTAVQSPGQNPYRLSDALDTHFNEHRAHLIPVLVEGVKYQYSDFFAGGMAMFKDLMPAKKPDPNTQQTGSSSPQ